MIRALLFLVAALAAACRGAGGTAEKPAADSTAAGPSADLLPAFTAEGRLVRPEGWEAWVLAGTSMGLTYNETATTPGPGEPPGNFLNVYLQPWAYAAFLESGEFPEGTMFVLAGSNPVRKADPARGGFYQGDLALMEVHLKRKGIDPTGWAFYGFGGGAETAEKIPGEAACYSCHRDEAGYDQVFVQFYPRIRERLAQGSPAAATTPPPAPATTAAPGDTTGGAS